MRAALGVAVVVAALVAVALLGAGRLLVVADPLPPRADAIVILAGSVPDRTLEAADLYRAGLAPRVVVTRERLPRGQAAMRARGVRPPPPGYHRGHLTRPQPSRPPDPPPGARRRHRARDAPVPLRRLRPGPLVARSPRRQDHLERIREAHQLPPHRALEDRPLRRPPALQRLTPAPRPGGRGAALGAPLRRRVGAFRDARRAGAA